MGTPNVLGDRVLVQTTTTGTGTYQLGSAVTGYLTPELAGVPSGSRVPFLVVDSLTAPTAFEIVEGVYTSGSPSTLTRALVRRNTTGGTSAVNWSAGTKYILFCPNAGSVPTLDTDGGLVAPGATLSGPLVSTSNVQLGRSGANGWLKVGNEENRVYSSGANLLEFSTNGTKRGEFDGSGNFTATGNVTAYSDARLKDQVETIADALDLVLRLRGVRYRRVDTGERGIGVIAQELAEVVPELVKAEGEFLSVAYGNLAGLLVEAMKALALRVAALEARR